MLSDKIQHGSLFVFESGNDQIGGLGLESLQSRTHPARAEFVLGIETEETVSDQVLEFALVIDEEHRLLKGEPRVRHSNIVARFQCSSHRNRVNKKISVRLSGLRNDKC